MLERKLTERHARALLALPSEDIQLRVFSDIIEKDLNVKQTETRVAFYKEAEKEEEVPKKRKVSFSKDVRLAVNTIRQSIDMIVGSGLKVDKVEQEYQDHYEITIKIPKR